MARLNGILKYPATASGTSTKTLLQLVTPANQCVVIKEVSISFAGTSPTAAPIEVNLVWQTSAGTMTALTPLNETLGSGETIQCTAQRDATAEPTTTNVIRTWYVHPQLGLLWVPTMPWDEIIIRPGGSARRMGLMVITPGASVSTTAYIRFEE